MKSKIQNPKLKIKSPHPRPLSLRERGIKGVRALSAILFVICHLSFVISPAGADRLLESVLKDGIGVRPLGMGGAFVSLANDANAAYYNPAGLADIGFNYIRGYLDYNRKIYDQHDYTILTLGSFGFANWRMITLGSEEIQVSSYSYGRTDERGVSWGMTFKNIYGDPRMPEERGWSVDFGLKAPGSPDFTIGILVQDLIENLNVPTSVRLGGTYRFNFLREGVLAAEAEIRNIRAKEGATVYPHYGAEGLIAESLILRAGWERDCFTAGLTASFPFLTLDYTQAIPATSGGETIHRVGIRVGRD